APIRSPSPWAISTTTVSSTSASRRMFHSPTPGTGAGTTAATRTPITHTPVTPTCCSATGTVPLLPSRARKPTPPSRIPPGVEGWCGENGAPQHPGRRRLRGVARRPSLRLCGALGPALVLGLPRRLGGGGAGRAGRGGPHPAQGARPARPRRGHRQDFLLAALLPDQAPAVRRTAVTLERRGDFRLVHQVIEGDFLKGLNRPQRPQHATLLVDKRVRVARVVGVAQVGVVLVDPFAQLDGAEVAHLSDFPDPQP